METTNKTFITVTLNNMYYFIYDQCDNFSNYFIESLLRREKNLPQANEDKF